MMIPIEKWITGYVSLQRALHREVLKGTILLSSTLTIPPPISPPIHPAHVTMEFPAIEVSAVWQYLREYNGLPTIIPKLLSSHLEVDILQN
jgi:hypothetical protein